MTEIDEYSLIQGGWVCQRCDKFVTSHQPKHKGCLQGYEHIYFAGYQTIAEIPKSKIQKIKAVIAKK